MTMVIGQWQRLQWQVQMLWQFQPPALSIQQLHVRVPLAILQARLPAVEQHHNDDDENFKEY